MIDIREKQNCCGCSACVQICPKQCISMSADNEGFLYPQVDSSICIECGLCEKVCPVINQNDPQVPLATYAAKNNNEEIRLKSSSGGVFSMLAEQIISEGGVVFGAKFDEDWTVVHDFVDSIDSVSVFRGSKYIQSNINESYKKAEVFLKSGRPVLFSGTPCQIAGLKHFLGQKKYENLLTIDVACHGVPSPYVWKKYLEEITNSSVESGISKSITEISFRNKEYGWKHYHIVIKGISQAKNCQYGQNCHNQVFLDELYQQNVYMQGFLHDLYLRPSCYACPAKLGRSGSDLTLADYWGIGRINRKFDDDRGVSLVLVNTPRGAKAYTRLSLMSCKSSYSQAISYNQALIKNAIISPFRDEFWQQFPNLGFSIVNTLCYKMRPKLMQRMKSIVIKIIKQIARIK